MKPENILNLAFTFAEVGRVDKMKRVIYGAKIIELGNVKDSRPFMVDEKTLEQVAEFGSRPNKGIKARMSHPTEDGIFVYLGRWKNFRVDGSAVRADLHFSDAAAKGPHGDLPDYILSLAEEDEDNCGVSIAAALSMNEMESTDQFPMPIRVSSLYACDVVGEPAATTGLFSMDEKIEESLNNESELSMNEDKEMKEEIVEEVLNEEKVVEETLAETPVVEEQPVVEHKSEVVEEVLSEELEQDKSDKESSYDCCEDKENCVCDKKEQEEDLEKEEKPEEEQFAELSELETLKLELAQLRQEKEDKERNELYISTFGQELGQEWFDKGLELNECLFSYVGTLKETISSQEQQLDDIKAEFAALRNDLGEVVPVSTDERQELSDDQKAKLSLQKELLDLGVAEKTAKWASAFKFKK